jgi:3-oxoacyl-[acyl-carrier-protein] synthase-3
VHLLPSHFASKVGEKLLRKSEVNAQDIDLLIYAGVCRDYIEPATAHVIHHHLKLNPQCLSFDISNACVGFLSAMLLAGQMIEAGQIRKALIVAGENAAPLLEKTINTLLKERDEEAYRASLASLTLGSGAVAMLLSHKKESLKSSRLLGAVSLIASQYYNLCLGRGDYQNPMMQTDSPRLFEKGVELSIQTWEIFLQKMKRKAEDFSHVFTHQVSVAHHERIFESLGIASHKGRIECRKFGNTGSIAAPLSLALAHEDRSLKKGDILALLGIGSGLNTVMLGIEW